MFLCNRLLGPSRWEGRLNLYTFQVILLVLLLGFNISGDFSIETVLDPLNVTAVTRPG